jgi:magnesium chelatase family protein
VGLALVHSRGQAGLEAYSVAVEVHIAGGLPGFSITGLPTTSVRESRDRVRAALQTCAVPIPARRVTVHLGPADVPKEGGRFDLPIALGVIHAEHRRDWDLTACEFLGELSLAGELRPVSGALPAIIAARDAGRSIVVPTANAREARHVEANTVRAAARLGEVLAWLDGCAELPRVAAAEPLAAPESALDFADIHGQEMPKRAVVIAAAGGHNLLLFGPPGSGKSMLAERLPTLLPPLSNRQYLTTAAIASLCGRAPPQTSAAPFRAPHHTATARALLGGGGRPRPGEVSLAHHGVLFLDELPEFRRDALEALREPLESGTVSISRAMHQTTFPAEFQLVAAMNPCPCGFSGDPERCSCTPAQLARYASRVSGPLLDRIDMHVEVPRVVVAPNASRFAAETPELRRSVAAARRRQIDRAGTVNAHLSAEQLRETARLSDDALGLLERCTREWQLSGRAIARTLKTARTIADIACADGIADRHVAEALQLRQLDRRFRGTGFAL